MSEYSNGFEFTTESGIPACVELLAPPRGVIRRFVLKQVSGMQQGYAADLFDRADACSIESEVSNSFEGNTPQTENKLLDSDLHRILPSIVVASGQALHEAFDIENGYMNRDEQDVRRTPNTRIYLQVVPAGSGEKIFHVAYTIEEYSVG